MFMPHTPSFLTRCLLLNMAAFAIVFATSESVRADLITNGSFEMFTGSFIPDTDKAAWGETDALVSDWTVSGTNPGLSDGTRDGGSSPYFTGNGISTSAPFLFPTDGFHHITTTLEGTATLTQTISGVAAGTYTLSFDASPQVTSGEETGALKATVKVYDGTSNSGAELQSLVMDRDAPTVSTNTWNHFSGTFTAISSNLFVEIQLVDARIGAQVSLDNVSIEAIPEPSSMLSLALIGLAAGAHQIRQRRKASRSNIVRNSIS